MAKYDIECVKGYLNDINYILLSKEYINSKSKLNMICDKGHEISMTFEVIKRGGRCKQCANKNLSILKKLDYDDVRTYIESFGYKMLSEKYESNTSKIKIKCSCGNIYNTTYASFKKGNRCRICMAKKVGKNLKFTYEYVKEYIESFGYKLISNEYVNAKKKIKIQCEKNHIYEAPFYRFKSGNRCPVCSHEKLNKSQTYSYDYVKQYIYDEGFELLSTDYVNSSTHLDIKCGKGHIFKSTFSNFKSNKGCKQCANDKLKLDYNVVRQEIEKEGYFLISDIYKNARSKLSIRCDKNHTYSTTYTNFKSGNRCPICNNSKGEQKIFKYLNDIGAVFIYQKIFDGLIGVKGKNLSYDFYLPDYNLLIEYQGEQHEKFIPGFQNSYEDFKRQLEHDKRKRQYAKDNNVKLLEIWYYDFDNIESILKEKLNL